MIANCIMLLFYILLMSCIYSINMTYRTKKVYRIIFSAGGSSAVEFALILPLLLSLLFGIVAYGSYISVVHSIQQIAAEAARSSIGGLTDAERAMLARQSVYNHAGSYLMIDPQKLFVEHAATDAGTSVFRVRLRYDADGMFIFQLPIISVIPNRQIIRSASVQRGGY